MLDPLFENAGSLRGYYEQVDWANTPLGPVQNWSTTLRSTVALALNTRFAVTLIWGDSFTLIYNEAYAEIIADKHPRALGESCEKIFPEAWDEIGPLLHGVIAGDGAVWQEDVPLMLFRNGILEEARFTYSYSPVHNSEGIVEGVLDITTETTEQVISVRRLLVLRRIAELANELKSSEGLHSAALPILLADHEDIPNADIVTNETRGDFWTKFPEDLPEHRFYISSEHDGEVAWIRLPGTEYAGTRPALAILLSPNLRFTAEYESFLELVATGLGSAWTLAVNREQEHARNQSVFDLALALQRSLLTDPPQLDDLEIAVRYRPAEEAAQIGGDWYDAFVTSEGVTSVVIGDVAGHDQQAAAAMGQVRNLLRGIGYTISDPPGAVLTRLDHAMRDLAVGGLSTAILANIESGANGRWLKWSNAGHPPPLLLKTDGTTELLQTSANLLLGVDPNAPRDDHSCELPPGSVVIFYTDGLVERRGATLEDGFAQLQTVVSNASANRLGLESLCDEILSEMSDDADDDIAILAIRTR